MLILTGLGAEEWKEAIKDDAEETQGERKKNKFVKQYKDTTITVMLRRLETHLKALGFWAL